MVKKTDGLVEEGQDAGIPSVMTLALLDMRLRDGRLQGWFSFIAWVEEAAIMGGGSGEYEGRPHDTKRTNGETRAPSAETTGQLLRTGLDIYIYFFCKMALYQVSLLFGN
jgi:uncharacterized membrane protein YhaH (DUF805 family)